MGFTVGTGRLPEPHAAPGVPTQGGTWTLPHQPEAVAQARRITERLLRAWHVAPPTADLVVLVVSELVTNAVEHARPPTDLQVTRDTNTGRVHIEVTDGGPAVREGEWAASCAEDEHGRGLRIIDLITAAHGDDRASDHITHWADVPVAA